MGCTAEAVGVAAAASGMTGTISAVGAAIGAAVGGGFGAGVGIATGGVAMAGTIPLAGAGAAIGAWAGPGLALLGIGTAPAWGVPVAVGGTLLAGGSLAVGTYKIVRRGWRSICGEAVNEGAAPHQDAS